MVNRRQLKGDKITFLLSRLFAIQKFFYLTHTFVLLGVIAD